MIVILFTHIDLICIHSCFVMLCIFEDFIVKTLIYRGHKLHTYFHYSKFHSSQVRIHQDNVCQHDCSFLGFDSVHMVRNNLCHTNSNHTLKYTIICFGFSKNINNDERKVFRWNIIRSLNHWKIDFNGNFTPLR